MPALASPRLWRASLAALVLLLAASRLPYPLDGDQALFLVYARQMAEGGRLYLDLWDTKQPGIFWFYGLAGRLFGHDGVGVHLLELLWLAAAAVLLRWAARWQLRHALAVELVPLLTVGLYYATASAWFMTQVEILVTLPLAAVMLAGLGVTHRPALAPLLHAVAGLGLCVVAVFKLVLLPVPLALWAVSTALALRGSPRRVRAMASAGLWLGLGAALPLAATAAWLVAQGSWDAFAWTSFVFPGLALQEAQPKTLRDGLRGALWFIAEAVPVALLWAVAWRRPGRPALRPIEWQCLAWLASGLLVIAAQRLSWWSYHHLLVLAPLGLLAACAIDRLLAGRTVDGRRAAVGFVALALLVMFALPARHTVATLRGVRAAMAAEPGQGLDAFRERIRPGHRQRLADAAFLREPAAGRSPVYVFGDPNWMLAAGRGQALAINGWSWEVMPRRLWVDFEQQFRARPPAWVYLHPASALLMQERAPALSAFIAERYGDARPTYEQGSWLRLRERP